MIKKMLKKNVLFTTMVTALTTTLMMSVADASVLSCEVAETAAGEKISSVVQANIDENNSHGDIVQLKFKYQPDITGMVAHMKGYAVLSLSYNPAGIHTSSIGDVSTGKRARHQMILPSSPGLKVNAIEIECFKAER